MWEFGVLKVAWCFKRGGRDLRICLGRIKRKHGTEGDKQKEEKIKQRRLVLLVVVGVTSEIAL